MLQEGLRSEMPRDYELMTANGREMQKEAPVLSQYGELSRELEVLGETFDNLRVRLEPITGPSLPESDGNGKLVATELSPLAESLRSDTQKVRSITHMLRSLMNRLEV